MISIVIPFYNAASLLPPLLARVDAALSALHQEAEIILINDASTDESWEVLTRLQPAYPRLRALNLPWNAGQHAALLLGMRAAKGDILITMDDDLQHAPKLFASLLAALPADAQLLYAYANGPYNGMRYHILSKAAKSLLLLLRMPHALHIGSYRVFRRELLSTCEGIRGTAFSLDGMFTRAHPRMAALAVTFHPRSQGISRYTLAASMRLFIHTLCSYLLDGWTGLKGGKALPPYTQLP